MINKIHCYELEKSFFYRLRNRKKLSEYLELDPRFFNTLSYKKFIVYKNFDLIKPNGGIRNINNPEKTLKAIQKVILKYLSRIETPDWLISGKRGRSYINNGIFHKEGSYVHTADIKTFYNNCKRTHIYKMFLNTFKMSPDIAGIMTDLVAHNNCLPTGSPVSQLIAYWTYNNIFKNIENFALKHDAKFSLYVDDMTFSSNKPISKMMIFEIEKELKSVQLEFKRSKNRFYSKHEYKLVTGVAIDPNKNIRVPNKLRKSILENWKELQKITNTKERVKKIRSLVGRLRCAQRIEPNIFTGISNQAKNI